MTVRLLQVLSRWFVLALRTGCSSRASGPCVLVAVAKHLGIAVQHACRSGDGTDVAAGQAGQQAAPLP
jgi:hypothetical protein